MIAPPELSSQERLLILLRIEQALARRFRLANQTALAAEAEALAGETAEFAQRMGWPAVWHLSEKEISIFLREHFPAGTPKESVERAGRLARELASDPATSAFFLAKEERLRRLK